MTTDRTLSKLNSYLKSYNRYKYAIIELGGNDCDFDWKAISEKPENDHLPKVDIKNFKNNLNIIVSQLTEFKITPIIITMPPISSSRYLNWFGKELNKDNILYWLKDENYIYKHHELYNLELMSFAHSNNIEVIDLRLLFLKVKNYEKYLCVDGIHINEEGHKYVEESFAKRRIKHE
jgi:lysophospholipase L1-like esterase